MEFGVFHNGGTAQPLTRTSTGLPLPPRDLANAHRDAQAVLQSQVRQGILTEELGFDFFMMTEHHFQPEGVEFSPNPLFTQAAVASRTERIRLVQGTNILTQWHPLRIAEQGAMLDVISNGRVEFGIGRGYQPREVETFGSNLGSTVQDEERNRAYFEEAYEIIVRAWTEPSFSHHGEFFTLPPSFTRWDSEVTEEFFEGPDAGRSVADVVDGTGEKKVLREISVFPQPLQKPYPQMWQPVTSSRSVQWTAEHGVNAQFNPQSRSRMKRLAELYFEAAEHAGWPDRRGSREFKYGWDAAERRGIMVAPWVHIIDAGPNEREQLERFDRGMELTWRYFGPFGFSAAFAEVDEKPDLALKPTGADVRNKGMAFVGTAEQVAESLLELQTTLGFDDLNIGCHFEVAGLPIEVIEDQMHKFAEDVMHVLRPEGGIARA